MASQRSSSATLKSDRDDSVFTISSPWQRRWRPDTTTPPSLATIHSLIGSSLQAPPTPRILTSLGNKLPGYSKPTPGVSSPIGASFTFPQLVSLPGESPLRYSRRQSPGSPNRSSSFSDEESCSSPFSPTARYHVDSATLFGGDFDSYRTPVPKVVGRPPLPPSARQTSLSASRTSSSTQLRSGDSKYLPRGRNVSDSESSRKANASYFKDTPRKSHAMKGDAVPNLKTPLHRTYSQQLDLSSLDEDSYYSSPETPPAYFREPFSRPDRQQPLFTIGEESEYSSPETPPAYFRTPFSQQDQQRLGKGSGYPSQESPPSYSRAPFPRPDRQQPMFTFGEESEYSSPESPPAYFRTPFTSPDRQKPMFSLGEESQYYSPESPPAYSRGPFPRPDQPPLRSVPTQRPLARWSSSSNLNEIDDSTISPKFPDFSSEGLSPSPPARPIRKKATFSIGDSLIPSSSQMSPEPFSGGLSPSPPARPIRKKATFSIGDSLIPSVPQLSPEPSSLIGPVIPRRRIPPMESSGLGGDEFWRHIKSDVATCSADTRRDDANIPFSKAGKFKAGKFKGGKLRQKMSKLSSGLQSISESSEFRPGIRAPPTRSTDTVSSLTGKTYQNFIKQQKMALIMFYSSATGGPVTPDAFSSYSVTAARGAKPAFATVDCAKESALCASQGVPSYPFYKLYSGGYLLKAVEDFG